MNPPSWMLDTERVALSNELWEVAQRFVLEGTQQTGRNAEWCGRTARLLAEHARVILTNGDIDVARAYAEAGTLMVERITESRRTRQARTLEDYR